MTENPLPIKMQSVPTNISTIQLLHLRLRDHCGRGDRKIVKDKIKKEKKRCDKIQKVAEGKKGQELRGGENSTDEEGIKYSRVYCFVIKQ